jgi:hypothetical protein
LLEVSGPDHGQDESSTSAWDRELLIGPRVGSGWVCVFDSCTDAAASPALESLAASLSAGGPCVSIAVHDGDFVEHALFEGGIRIEWGSSWPGYFQGRPPPAVRKRCPKAVGVPEAWRSLLVPGVTPAALGEAWQGRPGEAEALLGAIAPLLGWEIDWVCHGHATLPDVFRRQCHRLRFHASKADAGSGEPPRFDHCGGPDMLDDREGGSLGVDVIANNVGGPMAGLSIVLFGDAVTGGMLQAPIVELWDGASTRRTESQPAQESEGLFVTRFPNVTVAAGYSDVATAVAALGPGDGFGAWAAAQVVVKIRAMAGSPGSGELHVGLVPDANPQAGQTSWTIELRVSPR